MKVVFRPVTPDRWNDFESFFEAKGCPHYCWCTVWRHVDRAVGSAAANSADSASNKTSKTDKKASMKSRITKGVPVGILGYLDDEAIAWCSIAPRDTYKPLGGSATDKVVWSVVCFFIKRSYRNMGISHQLLRAAIGYAKSKGAQRIEAYPVAPDSPSYRFMGYTRLFEKAGFRFVKKAGKRRNVMTIDL